MATLHHSGQSRMDVAAWLLAGFALVATLMLHLLPALLAGLLVYELVHVLAPRLRVAKMSQARGKLVAAGLLASLIVLALVAAALGALAFFRSEAGSVTALFDKLADIVESSRATLPAWVVERLPENAEDLKAAVVDWFRTHGRELQQAGAEAGRVLVHVLIGLVVGALVALHEARPSQDLAPLARALQERSERLGDAFRRIVFAQVRISAINTALTGIYLLVILPVSGVNLPLGKTMIAVTFLAGLIPVLGNLISNTLIVIVSLSHSLTTAVASLVFLVVIHKLEYFVNARIIGTQIRARAWELLIAMLAMEAAFGVAGVIAAPIYYAYLKDELAARGVI